MSISKRLSRNILLLLAVFCLSRSVFAKDIIVALDGSGDYKTVQEAVNAAQSGTKDHPTIIYIKPGKYIERVHIQREKRYLRLIGDNPSNTTVSYNLYASMTGSDGKQIGTFSTPTLQIDSDDFSAKNITFENSAGPVGQAIATRIDGDRVQFSHCRFSGWQDTVLDNRGRHYYKECEIRGTVDFIFGSATALFDHCHIVQIRDKGGPFTAPSTDKDQQYGLIFLYCIFASDKASIVRSKSSVLMRPWRAYGETAVIHCTLGDVVSEAGWGKWSGKELTCRAWEYGSKTLSGNPIDISKRAEWSKQLTKDQAKSFTIENILGGWKPESY